jgi:hypothetical protein
VRLDVLSNRLLDQLAARNGLKRAIFTAAGYGLQNRVVGGGQPFFNDLNPVPRMYAFSAFNALNGGYLRLSQNPAPGNAETCFGDSGGPDFLQLGKRPVLVAIAIAGDAVCRSTNADYRLDTPSAQQLLSPYVTLPCAGSASAVARPTSRLLAARLARFSAGRKQ